MISPANTSRPHARRLRTVGVALQGPAGVYYPTGAQLRPRAPLDGAQGAAMAARAAARPASLRTCRAGRSPRRHPPIRSGPPPRSSAWSADAAGEQEAKLPDAARGADRGSGAEGVFLAALTRGPRAQSFGPCGLASGARFPIMAPQRSFAMSGHARSIGPAAPGLLRERRPTSLAGRASHTRGQALRARTSARTVRPSPSSCPPRRPRTLVLARSPLRRDARVGARELQRAGRGRHTGRLPLRPR